MIERVKNPLQTEAFFDDTMQIIRVTAGEARVCSTDDLLCELALIIGFEGVAQGC